MRAKYHVISSQLYALPLMHCHWSIVMYWSSGRYNYRYRVHMYWLVPVSESNAGIYKCMTWGIVD